MKKLDLGQTLGLIANLGVIAGILLLVFELNQNRDMMRAQTRNEISRGVVELLSSTSTSVELADAWARARQGEMLPPAQAVMLETFTESLYRYWENSHYQYRQGLYDEDEFSVHLDLMVRLVSNDRQLTGWWCRNQRDYSDRFVTELNDQLPSDLCN